MSLITKKNVLYGSPDTSNESPRQLFVRMWILESEYNTISFNPKFYYISVTRERLTNLSHLNLSLFSSIFFFIFLPWQLGWLDFGCGWSDHLEFGCGQFFILFYLFIKAAALDFGRKESLQHKKTQFFFQPLKFFVEIWQMAHPN